MATYLFNSSNASTTTSANIATDKVRIATVGSILYATGFPNVSGNGTATSVTNSKTFTGVSTSFLTQLGNGYWLGNSTGSTIGIVASIQSDTSLTLTANAQVAITGGTYKYSPYGTRYVDDALNIAGSPNSSGILPAGTIANSIIVGQGNVVTFLGIGAAERVSITELGAPHANTGTTGF